MKRLWAAALLLAACAEAGGASALTNILVNPGFESGSLTPWTATFAPTVTTAYAHSGNDSVQAYSQDAIMQIFAAQSDASLTDVSFWEDRPGATVLVNQVWFYYSDGTKVMNLTLLPDYTGGWHQFDVTADLAPGKSLDAIQIYGTTDLSGAPHPAYLDDIVVGTGAVVPEPGTWWLMVLGFGALGAGLRQRRFAIGGIS